MVDGWVDHKAEASLVLPVAQQSIAGSHSSECLLWVELVMHGIKSLQCT